MPTAVVSIYDCKHGNGKRLDMTSDKCNKWPRVAGRGVVCDVREVRGGDATRGNRVGDADQLEAKNGGGLCGTTAHRYTKCMWCSYVLGLIINEQFGFRPNHSCPQQTLRLVEYISEGFKVKRNTVAVFFDVAKAFDRVWHAGFIHKVYQLELPDRLVIIIYQYISNRHFTFRLDNTYSSVRPIRAGVPQGSTFSPLLYSAYVNDIPRPKSGTNSRFSRTTLHFFLGQTASGTSYHVYRGPLMS
ncbi:RNA-directed DNA polymerase from mobile element jockey [Eumeta japonica]|uniref:RNA-directed DNA polymerase from mobile element jockey n=1 Tax=Eumeta variegata TaxID=151549 RepID=A0A4C1VAT9_EUMVA|nr:RNA-directed DNA polymerase from mobile element jockey [Eumeta japonica]